ncbi:MAG: flagellar type III secretion system protein FlhB [Ahrensia sp.]|nr:flagellar type III secretion system protein FlhB [Ahrensia sp.]
MSGGSDDNDPESKTEEPTETRIADALKKGQVAMSREVMVLASMLALTAWLVFVAPNATGSLVFKLKSIFEHAGTRDINSSTDALILLSTVSLFSVSAVLVLFVFLFVFILAGAFIQAEPRFVATRIQPKISHISLLKGWTRMFGKAGLAEFVKALVKLTVAIVIAISVLGAADNEIVALMWKSPALLTDFVVSQIGALLSGILIAMVVVAVGDFMWSKKRWRDGLKMTRKEISDELKQAEGDPVVKSRLRSLARDRSRHRMLGNVGTATLILTNPTHLAIALRYKHGQDNAPVVVAKGADHLCMRIREAAQEHDIPIFEKKPLARALYPIAVVDQPIPEEFYAAIADLINIIHEKAAQTGPARA